MARLQGKRNNSELNNKIQNKFSIFQRLLLFFVISLFCFCHGIRASGFDPNIETMSDDDKKSKTKTAPFLISVDSPYYLHPSEGPGASITSVLFNGNNFELWRKAVRTALNAKNKLKFVDGRISKPSSEGDELDAWDRVNSMLCS